MGALLWRSVGGAGSALLRVNCREVLRPRRLDIVACRLQKKKGEEKERIYPTRMASVFSEGGYGNHFQFAPLA